MKHLYNIPVIKIPLLWIMRQFYRLFVHSCSYLEGLDDSGVPILNPWITPLTNSIMISKFCLPMLPLASSANTKSICSWHPDHKEMKMITAGYKEAYNQPLLIRPPLIGHLVRHHPLDTFNWPPMLHTLLNHTSEFIAKIPIFLGRIRQDWLYFNRAGNPGHESPLNPLLSIAKRLTFITIDPSPSVETQTPVIS